jgi:hypothetical protein
MPRNMYYHYEENQANMYPDEWDEKRKKIDEILDDPELDFYEKNKRILEIINPKQK